MKKLFLAASTATTTLLVHAQMAVAAAAEDSEKKAVDLPLDQVNQQATGPSSGDGSITRTLFGLVMVVAVIYGLYWILKQVKKSKEEAAHGSGLHSLATLPLGPNRSLHMIKAGREIVLVGVAEGGVHPVRSYTEQEAYAAGLLASEDNDADGANGNGNGNGKAKFGAGKSQFATPTEAVKGALETFRQKTVRK